MKTLVCHKVAEDIPGEEEMEGGNVLILAGEVAMWMGVLDAFTSQPELQSPESKYRLGHVEQAVTAVCL